MSCSSKDGRTAMVKEQKDDLDRGDAEKNFFKGRERLERKARKKEKLFLERTREKAFEKEKVSWTS